MLRKVMAYAAVFLLSLVIAGPAMGDALKGINLMTEYYPPFNYEKDDELQGISIDLLFHPSNQLKILAHEVLIY